jgi:hypothetical protein
MCDRLISQRRSDTRQAIGGQGSAGSVRLNDGFSPVTPRGQKLTLVYVR